jgi:chromate transport protein ChrA
MVFGGYSMLIAGTIICGGGPVVIPLLRGYTVDPGWVSEQEPTQR